MVGSGLHLYAWKSCCLRCNRRFPWQSASSFTFPLVHLTLHGLTPLLTQILSHASFFPLFSLPLCSGSLPEPMDRLLRAASLRLWVLLCDLCLRFPARKGCIHDTSYRRRLMQWRSARYRLSTQGPVCKQRLCLLSRTASRLAFGWEKCHNIQQGSPKLLNDIDTVPISHLKLSKAGHGVLVSICFLLEKFAHFRLAVRLGSECFFSISEQ